MSSTIPKFLIVVLISMSILVGCSTSRLPPNLGDEDLAKIQNLHFDVAVGVERYKFPAYSDNLLSVLSDLKVFDDVFYSDSGKSFQLIARVESEVHGEAVIPLLTAITLGVIPTIVNENHGVVFSLSDRKANVKTFIYGEYRDKVILGWVALPMKLLPQYTGSGTPEESIRYLNLLKLKLHDSVYLKNSIERQP